MIQNDNLSANAFIMIMFSLMVVVLVSGVIIYGWYLQDSNYSTRTDTYGNNARPNATLVENTVTTVKTTSFSYIEPLIIVGGVFVVLAGLGLFLAATKVGRGGSGRY